MRKHGIGSRILISSDIGLVVLFLINFMLSRVRGMGNLVRLIDEVLLATDEH